MSLARTNLNPDARERFSGVLEKLQSASRTLSGRSGSSVYDQPALQPGYEQLQQEYSGAIGWFNEVSDPVEADSYRIGDVKISDFVTPAWFNDGVGGRFDFMGVCQQPFWIRPGGYAQYLDNSGWQVVYNFRKGHPADAGFSKGDPSGRKEHHG